MRNYENYNNEPIVQVHIADIHFGCVDPQKEHAILHDQFLSAIASIKFHILAIDGDLFHKKYMANSDPIYYAIAFINECADICRRKNATLVILEGTKSHDADQLRLFEYYTNDSTIDVRIVRNISIIRVYGLNILCIPEEYGKSKEYYFEYLAKPYDCCFFHGTMVGSVYGANYPDLDSPKYPIFDINSFSSCKGPIIGGHVHKAMCLNSDIYYVSNPIRFQFGEEEDKGYAIVIINPDGSYYYQFMPIQSFRYDTIHINTIQFNDPNSIIQYLDRLKENGIDHIRIDFTNSDRDPNIQKLLEQYYASDNTVTIKANTNDKLKIDTTPELEEKHHPYMDLVLDGKMDKYEKIVQYINIQEGSTFISVDKLKELLN